MQVSAALIEHHSTASLLLVYLSYSILSLVFLAMVKEKLVRRYLDLQTTEHYNIQE